MKSFYRYTLLATSLLLSSCSEMAAINNLDQGKLTKLFKKKSEPAIAVVKVRDKDLKKDQSAQQKFLAYLETKKPKNLPQKDFKKYSQTSSALPKDLTPVDLNLGDDSLTDYGILPPLDPSSGSDQSTIDIPGNLPPALPPSLPDTLPPVTNEETSPASDE